MNKQQEDFVEGCWLLGCTLFAISVLVLLMVYIYKFALYIYNI